MKEQRTIEGRSLIFNMAFVLLNLTGLAFLAMGFHKNFTDQKVLFLIIGLVLMSLTIVGMIAFKGRLMMASFSRVLVGGLFIVSGLVKANDPIGFAYKLEEYFEDGALAYRIKELFGAPGFSLEFLIDYALAISVIICIVEIVLGVLVIIGGKIRLVSYLMMLMMIFFTFLTWHTASCDKDKTFVDRNTYQMSDDIAQIKIDEAPNNEDITIVSQNNKTLVVDEVMKPQCVDDCGCFGDAMKGSVGRSLTPAESLWKDLVLMYLVLWIFLAQRLIRPNTGRQNLIFISTSLLVITFFSWIFGWYFPIIFGAISILGALWILRAGGKILGNYWGSILLVIILCTLLVSYVLIYVPLKDYRPYAVGENLVERMNDGVIGEYKYYYFITDLEADTTARVEMSRISPEMWANKDKWETKYDTTEVVVEPKNPSIMDYDPMINIADIGEAEKSLAFVKEALDSLMTKQYKILALEYNEYMMTPEEEYDPVIYPANEYRIEDTIMAISEGVSDISVKNATLEAERIVILISRDLDKANWKTLEKIKAIYETCQHENIPFIMVCNATREDIDKFRKEKEFNVPVFTMDGIELKVISRANPALMILEKGTVTGKYGFRSVPSKELFVEKHLD